MYMNYRSCMMLIGSKSGKKKQIWKKNSMDCLGTGNALFFYFDQFSYFSHNFLISNPI